MKICLINLDYKPNRSSGLTVYGELLAEGLAQKGHEVSVICSNHNNSDSEETINKVKIYRVGPVRFDWIHFSYLAAKKLNELNKKEVFDIVHFLDVHFAYNYKGYFLASLLQSFRQRLTADNNLPYHSSFFNLVQRYVLYNFCKILEIISLKKADFFISVSNATKNEFIENYHIPSKKIKTIHIGIPFNKKDSNQSKFKNQLCINKNETVLLFVGFLNPRKGIKYLIQAFNKINKPAKLILIGKWENDYKNKILHLIKKKGKVIVAGFLPDSELYKYYSIADILIVPSLLEGFGIPVIEAMHLGIPVIASNAGSLPEIAGEAGIIVKKRSTKFLLKAINLLIKDENLRKKIGNIGKERAKKYFLLKNMIINYETIYKEYLKKKSN